MVMVMVIVMVMVRGTGQARLSGVFFCTKEKFC